MPNFQMNTLDPPDNHHHTAAEVYENSDEFTVDALEWASDNPTPRIVETVQAEYRQTARYATAVDDIAAGARSVA